MAKLNIERLAKRVMSAQLAGRNSDPRFYSGLNVLPNPDPILRAMGQADETYMAIAADAHVIGELRSVRSGLLGYELRIVDGVEGEPQGKDLQAYELGKLWFEECRPAPRMNWQDTVWNIGTAVFFGRRIHELVWKKQGPWILPTMVLDRPNRRFVFDTENELRLLTKENQVEGEETDDYKFVVTRHMPSAENPYGQALLSSCFWPYTFKHGGFKFFYKFCERYGLPWPIGRYPAGTEIADQNKLLDALVQMTEDGAAVVPEGDTVELMTASHSGELAQEALIHLCNREMSKALTSQTLATEMRQVGSNAASKTHDDRQQRVQDSDRGMVAESINEILRWITLFNIGEDAVAPRLEFYKPKQISTERLEAWRLAASIARPSRTAFHQEMNIPEAESDEDLMAMPVSATLEQTTTDFSKCPGCGQAHNFSEGEEDALSQAAASAADKAIEDSWIRPAFELLREFESKGKSLLEYRDALPRLYGALDDEALVDITSQVLELAKAQGMEGIS
ncbi:MAG: DUF935 family protein [Porticoccaceae bacterium]|nr:DUF935 family protein [Porticoccaceae bacterium]